jgi:hypothetical protein
MNWEWIPIVIGLCTITGFVIRLFERIKCMETKIEPIWAFVTQSAIEKLHSHDDEHGLDRLLEKFNDHTISLREAIELRKLLQEKLDEIPPKKKIAASLIGVALDEMIKEHKKRVK